MKPIPALLVLSVTLLMFGCQTPSQSGDRLTVGKVQKEIRIGMSGAEVAAALGSPNIVTTDEQRREVWVYDKMATTTAYSHTEGGVCILVLGVGSGSGERSTSQHTLTVIVKFDEDKKVRDFAYHSSSF
jgi:outer membrane protein assembly factor BamE (lipoprotein component of BamABCDE complex)